MDPAARARIDQWKLSLLEVVSSAEERLLDAGACLVFPDADARPVALALEAGTSFRVDAEGGPPVEDRLAAACTQDELARALAILRREVRLARTDRGAQGLWLALGGLRREDDGAIAPLALWPVELERDGGGFRIAASPDRPIANPLLAATLRREHGLVVVGSVGFAEDGASDRPGRFAAPTGELAGATGLAELLELARGFATTRPGWRVETSVRLGAFAPERALLWADLESLGDALYEPAAGAVGDDPRRVLGHLATQPGIALAQPSGAAAAAVTQRPRDVEQLLAPLDADLTQLAAVAAAGAGATFVLSGPPGTGKSQTIANLLVHCATAGKNVLFVSKKAQALDVVQQRLAALGLGELCLDVHAPAASGAQIAAQLGRVLERPFRPGAGPTDDERLAELRAALDGHAAALHRVGPLGRSVHEVLGRLVELRTAPRAALADADAVGLDATAFGIRLRAVAALAEAALPVEPVAGHPWAASTLLVGVTDESDGGRRSSPVIDAEIAKARGHALWAIDEVATASEALDGALRQVATLVPGLAARTRGHIEALGALAAIAAGSPRPGAEMLGLPRAGRPDDLDESVALLRARGGGTLEAPKDPHAFVALAHRHRTLVAEVGELFTDRVAQLDAPALWTQLRKWIGSVGPVRYVALRPVRAEIRAVAAHGKLETDEAMLAGLEAVIAERACHAALTAATGPARRWFGELCGDDPLAVDLRVIESTLAWVGELRRAFDAVAIVAGPDEAAARGAAWRALVAQLAAAPDLVSASGRMLAVADPSWSGRLLAAADPSSSGRLVAVADASHSGRTSAVEAAFWASAPDADPSAAPVDRGSGASVDRSGPVAAHASGGSGRVAVPVPVQTVDLAPFGRLSEAVQRWTAAVPAFVAATGIEVRAEIDDAKGDAIAALRERAATLRAAIDAMPAWLAFHAARRVALAAGARTAVTVVDRGDLGAAELAPAWERATLLAWVEAEIADTPALARFHGAAHHAHVAAFADLDRAALALVRSRALARLADRVPSAAERRVAVAEAQERTRSATTPPRAADTGRPASGPAVDTGRTAGPAVDTGRTAPRAAASIEIATLLAARHLGGAVRDLLLAVPTLALRLAPCVLATPHAVARHLPAELEFDVVVFDEASQLSTGEALGALARARAAVIVGDAQQMPPAHGESVLAAALAARVPELQLAWHYRSRHEDLIAFANAAFYRDGLQVLPATHASPDLGVSWKRTFGTFDVGVDAPVAAAGDSWAAPVVVETSAPGNWTAPVVVETSAPGNWTAPVVADPAAHARETAPVVVDPDAHARETAPVLVDPAAIAADAHTHETARLPVSTSDGQAPVSTTGDQVDSSVAVAGSPDDALAQHLGAAPDVGPDPAALRHAYLTGVNRAEAEAVVAEVIARLKDPAQCTRSMAVVACSPAQRALIEDLLDEARANDAAVDAVVELIGGGAVPVIEPVIVKEVADVQGDERDVVLLSIGFTPGPVLDAYVHAHALAVATTRAREQLVVFSSFAPEELPAQDLLGGFLTHARTGGAGRAQSRGASPITAAIARALGERGWTVRHQVGCGAFTLELAVVDPSDPDRYVIAIETDGAGYASASAARDRDRLRAQVLAQLGWRTHRIWSLDWWHDAEREIQRAHGAIVTALAATRQRRTVSGPTRVARPPRGSQPPATVLAGRPADGGIVRIPPKRRSAEMPAVAPPELVPGQDGAVAEVHAGGASPSGSSAAQPSRRDPIATPSSASSERVPAPSSASQPSERVPAPSSASQPSERVPAPSSASQPSERVPAPSSASQPSQRVPAPSSASQPSERVPAPSSASQPSQRVPSEVPSSASHVDTRPLVAPTAIGSGSGAIDRPVGVAAVSEQTRPIASLAATESGGVEGIPPDRTSAKVAFAAGSAPVRLARGAIALGPYTAAAIPPGRRTPDDMFAARHTAELGKVIEQVLAAEAPMHVDLLARRVGAYFGVGRVTQRVRDHVCGALEGRCRRGDEPDVVYRLDQDPAAVPGVRVAGASPTGRRDILEIPLQELAAAARVVVERAPNIGPDDLVRDAARLVGFARLTTEVTTRVGAGVRLAQTRELIAIAGGRVTLPD